MVADGHGAGTVEGVRFTPIAACVVALSLSLGCAQDGDRAPADPGPGSTVPGSTVEAFCGQLAQFPELIGEDPPGSKEELDALRVRLDAFTAGAPAELREPLGTWVAGVLEIAQVSVDGGDMEAAGSQLQTRPEMTQAQGTLSEWAGTNCPGAGSAPGGDGQ